MTVDSNILTTGVHEGGLESDIKLAAMLRSCICNMYSSFLISGEKKSSHNANTETTFWQAEIYF